MEYNIRNTAIQWQISTSIKVLARISTFTVLDILRYEIFHFENLGQGHGV